MISECLTRSGLAAGLCDIAGLGARVAVVQAGEVICAEGDARCDRLWVVAEGGVEVRRNGTLIVVRPAVSLLGEQGLLTGEPRTAELRAQTRTKLLVVEKDAIDNHPERPIIIENIARILSVKLAGATGERARVLTQLATSETALQRFVGSPVFEHLVATEAEVGRERRRMVAVLAFFDIEGFSRRSADLDPEGVGELVTEFMTPLVAEIEASGGYVSKFMGDGAFAFWPAPGATRARMCCRAVAASRRVLGCIRDLGLDLRVGLHVGEVVAGAFGTRERADLTLLGDAVNRAARLEQARGAKGKAPLGSIRVSEDVFSQLEPSDQGLFTSRRIMAKNIGELSIFTMDGPVGRGQERR